MKQKLKLLKLKQVKIDEEVYPRDRVDFFTVARYINAANSGAEFPPITVANFEGKYLLVDGGHRLETFRKTKQTHIQAEVLENLTKKQIYLEAIKRNGAHGKQFTTYETTKIIMKLKAWKLDDEAISKLVRIPATRIESFVAERMTRITDTKENIALKRAFTHLSDSDVRLSDEVEQTQRNFAGMGQEHLLQEVITLFQKRLLDFSNKVVMRKVKKLKKVITEFVSA